MITGKRGLSFLLSLFTVAALSFVGCAEDVSSPGSKNSNAGPGSGNDSESVPGVEIDLANFSGEECLNIEELFGFIDRNSKDLVSRRSSYDFKYDSTYRVRRNFILMLATGTVYFEEMKTPKFEDFQGAQQDGCGEVRLQSSLGEYKVFAVSDYSPKHIQFSNEEKDVEYRIEVTGKDTMHVLYRYPVVDFQCHGETDVDISYTENIRLARSIDDFPSTESISREYIGLIDNATQTSLSELTIADSADSNFVEIPPSAYEAMMKSEVNPQIFTCTDVQPEPTPPVPPEEGTPPADGTPPDEVPEADVPEEGAPDGEIPEEGTPGEGTPEETPVETPEEEAPEAPVEEVPDEETPDGDAENPDGEVETPQPDDGSSDDDGEAPAPEEGAPEVVEGTEG